MAEAAVSFVANRLADALSQIELHADIHKDIRRLHDDLRRMRCFLRDADAKQDEDERVCNWVSEIRELAYDAEDLVDNFILVLQDPVKRNVKKKHFLKRFIPFLKEWKPRSKIADGLEAIRLRLRDVSASREIYGIRNVGEGSTPAGEMLRNIRRSSPRDEDRDIVGLEDDTASLVDQLVQMGRPGRHVLSIVGMGGIGKTTLARKVYNHDSVIAHFPFRAWIFVSQKVSARDIMQGILRQVAVTNQRHENLLDEELETKVYECLQGTRYLVVLDDIWNAGDWDCLKKAFPDKNSGSRLLLTTRNRHIALHADPLIVPFELNFLSRNNSWELFCRKAFLDTVETRHSPVLEEIGEEIVERCGGLPLAIIVIGGLLSKKRQRAEWERVLNSMNSLFARDPTGVSAILALSYNDLPYYLKACFLYMGLFPEDYSIPSHKLFRLWIAEGFVSPDHQEENMEEVAEDYLNELIERNMVQVGKRSANERVKHCRLHDILRDLAISKAKIENFLEIPGSVAAPSMVRSRRHPIYSSSHLSVIKQSTSPLRSLLFFRVITQVRYKFHKVGRSPNDLYRLSNADFYYISSSFKLLRTIELETISCEKIPPTIGQLIHLTYLGLKQTNICSLPSTLGTLRKLQTLDIAGNPLLKAVPGVIWRLENLRHLYMCGHKHANYLKVDTLELLQTLFHIHVDEWIQNNPARLTSLRKLGIKGELIATDRTKLFNSIIGLQQLRSLRLDAEDGELPSLAELVSARELIKLHLKGRVTRLPYPKSFPPKLSQITLELAFLKQDSIKILAKLPKLLILRLRMQSYTETELVIPADGFPQLEVLEFSNLESLREFSFDESSIVRLRTLRIVNCRQLKMLPEEVKLLSSLQKLEIEQMPKDFADRLRGEDFHKVRRISSIKFA